MRRIPSTYEIPHGEDYDTFFAHLASREFGNRDISRHGYVPCPVKCVTLGGSYGWIVGPCTGSICRSLSLYGANWRYAYH